MKTITVIALCMIGAAFFMPRTESDTPLTPATVIDQVLIGNEPCPPFAASWPIKIGGVADDGVYAVAIDSADNIVAAGATESTNWITGGYDTEYGGGVDGFVVKLSPEGATLWSTYIGDDGEDWCYGVAVDANDNVFVCGESDSWTASTSGFIVKLSPAGALIWRKTWNSYLDDTFIGIAVDSAGNVVVNGYSEFEWGNMGGLCVKYAADGVKLWQYSYGGQFFNDWGSGVATDYVDNIILTGTTNMGYWLGPYYANLDPFVIKLTPAGEFMWGYLAGAAYNETGRDVTVDADGAVYITGETMTPREGWHDKPTNDYEDKWDAYMLKLSPNGSYMWSGFIGTTLLDVGWGVAVQSDSTSSYGGDVVVVGETATTPTGFTDTNAMIHISDRHGKRRRFTTWGGVGYQCARAVAYRGAGDLVVVGIDRGDGFVTVTDSRARNLKEKKK